MRASGEPTRVGLGVREATVACALCAALVAGGGGAAAAMVRHGPEGDVIIGYWDAAELRAAECTRSRDQDVRKGEAEGTRPGRN